MKVPHLILLSLPLLVLSVGCGTTDSPNSQRVSANSQPKDFDRSKPPRKGMSQAQVRKLYGEPNHVMQTGRGEMWSYSFDSWKLRMPIYNMTAKIKTGTVTFNASGQVVDFQWSQSESLYRMAF